MKRWLLYLVCIISILILNVLYVEYQFYILLLFVLIVPFISWILFLLSTIGLKMYMQLPKTTVSVGENIAVRVKCINKRVTFLGKQSYIVGMHYSNTKEDESENLEITADTEAVGISLIDFTPVHCGIVDINIKKARLQDYLGIFTAKRDFKGKCELVVMPEPVLSLRVKPYAERQQEYSVNNNREEDTEVVDLREFQPGDKLNRVHWNMSVRTDELIVKQYGDMDSLKYAVLVDLTQGNEKNFRDILDKLYTAVYSIANMYMENEFEVVLAAWNEEAAFMETCKAENAEELIQAMYKLMKIKCSDCAGEKLLNEYFKENNYLQNRTVLVTTKDYDVNWIYSVNVVESDLQGIIDDLWQKM